MEKKRRTPKEIIEAEGFGEHSYVKAPRGELISTTKESNESTVKMDSEKEYEFWRDRGEKKGTHLHTHPYYPKEAGKGHFSALPSLLDIRSFILNKIKVGTETIAQKHYQTGELHGYTNIHLKPTGKIWGERSRRYNQSSCKSPRNAQFCFNACRRIL
jgi:hypothetical protein